MFLYTHGIQFYILCNVPMILMNRIFCSWSIWNGHFTFFFFLTRGLLPPHIPFVSLNELPIKIGIPLFSIVIVQSILFCRQLKQLFIHYYNINTCTTNSDSNHNNTQLRLQVHYLHVLVFILSCVHVRSLPLVRFLWYAHIV